MHEPPDVHLPLPRACPFRVPPAFSDLRAAPGLATGELPGGMLTWLVTRLDDARAALSAAAFTADRSDPLFPMPQKRPAPAGAPRPAVTPAERRARGRRASLIGMDPPDHTVARRAVIGEFTTRRVHLLRPRIQQIVDERIDAILAGGPPADLVAAPVAAGAVAGHLRAARSAVCEARVLPIAQHDAAQPPGPGRAAVRGAARAVRLPGRTGLGGGSRARRQPARPPGHDGTPRPAKKTTAI